MKRIFGLLLPALLAACYTPEPFEAETVNSASSTQSKIGTLYAVNNEVQICNPSVSQDTVNYPASMLTSLRIRSRTGSMISLPMV